MFYENTLLRHSRQTPSSPYRVYLQVRVIVKLGDGNEVEVAQVAGRHIIPATARRAHCSTEQHIHNAPPAVV